MHIKKNCNSNPTWVFLPNPNQTNITIKKKPNEIITSVHGRLILSVDGSKPGDRDGQRGRVGLGEAEEVLPPLPHRRRHGPVAALEPRFLRLQRLDLLLLLRRSNPEGHEGAQQEDVDHVVPVADEVRHSPSYCLHLSFSTPLSSGLQRGIEKEGFFFFFFFPYSKVYPYFSFYTLKYLFIYFFNFANPQSFLL